MCNECIESVKKYTYSVVLEDVKPHYKSYYLILRVKITSSSSCLKELPVFSILKYSLSHDNRRKPFSSCVLAVAQVLGLKCVCLLRQSASGSVLYPLSSQSIVAVASMFPDVLPICAGPEKGLRLDAGAEVCWW